MKRWQIVYGLPLEVWVEIFHFSCSCISREKFGKLIDRIGNFKFAEHAQFFLHEWGKRTLGGVYFDQKIILDGLCKYVDDDPIYLEIPQTEMPENIKAFDSVRIKFVYHFNFTFIFSHFNVETIHFLGLIRPLLTGIRLDLDVLSYRNRWFLKPKHSDLANLRTILINLVPMLDSIHTLCCNDESALLIAAQSIPERFAKIKVLKVNVIDGRTWSLSCDECALPVLWQCISREQFTKLQVLKYFQCFIRGGDKMVREHVNTIVDWLNQPDLPKLCEIHLYSDNGFSEQISTKIRQQFQTAKTACTFAVNVRTYHHPIAEFHLENGIGEQLHGAYVAEGVDVKDAYSYRPAFQITRHSPANYNTEQLQEWIRKGMKRTNQNSIQICNPTVGSFDAPQMDVPNANEEQDIKQQPSTSKQA